MIFKAGWQLKLEEQDRKIKELERENEILKKCQRTDPVSYDVSLTNFITRIARREIKHYREQQQINRAGLEALENIKKILEILENGK